MLEQDQQLSTVPIYYQEKEIELHSEYIEVYVERFDVAPEILLLVLDYIDAKTCLQIRLVCQKLNKLIVLKTTKLKQLSWSKFYQRHQQYAIFKDLGAVSTTLFWDILGDIKSGVYTFTVVGSPGAKLAWRGAQKGGQLLGLGAQMQQVGSFMVATNISFLGISKHGKTVQAFGNSCTTAGTVVTAVAIQTALLTLLFSTAAGIFCTGIRAAFHATKALGNVTVASAKATYTAGKNIVSLTNNAYNYVYSKNEQTIQRDWSKDQETQHQIVVPTEVSFQQLKYISLPIPSLGFKFVDHFKKESSGSPESFYYIIQINLSSTHDDTNWDYKIIKSYTHFKNLYDIAIAKIPNFQLNFPSNNWFLRCKSYIMSVDEQVKQIIQERVKIFCELLNFLTDVNCFYRVEKEVLSFFTSDVIVDGENKTRT